MKAVLASPKPEPVTSPANIFPRSLPKLNAALPVELLSVMVSCIGVPDAALVMVKAPVNKAVVAFNPPEKSPAVPLPIAKDAAPRYDIPAGLLAALQIRLPE
jgi:hypothetical protein